MERSILLRPYPILATVFTAVSFDLVAQPILTSNSVSQISHRLPVAAAAQSPVQQKLQALAAPQHSRAMAWLQSFSFHQNDVSSLRLDNNGAVYYSDALLPKPDALKPPVPASALAMAQNVDVFTLHSKPGSSNKVFLDFDGEVISGRAWNDSASELNAAGYDLDNNPTHFNDEERSRIAEIWHRVAEDYAPFDIDVTTQLPEKFGSKTGHILFTRDTDKNGLDLPSKGNAGVSYVNVWGLVDYENYSPALVYYNVLDSGYAPYMAEVAAHEFGHNLGLSHDGTLEGSANTFCMNNTEYYCGLGSGASSWAPIMGVGYYANVTEWSKGEYPYANNDQDDIAIIKQKLNYRVDDVRNVLSQASPLFVEHDGRISVTNPENDPLNSDAVNKGIIESRDDIDVFSFEAATGPVDITVNPAWAAYYRSHGRGANLDIHLGLYDNSGRLISSAHPDDETNASISAELSAGRYYLAIAGGGNPHTPYSDYGSLGEYFISGRISTARTIDNLAPTPNPMRWASQPAAQDRNSIVMTAALASDASGTVQYRFRCLSGGAGCADSQWQASRTYVAAHLAPGNRYGFAVSARDLANNITMASGTAWATTNINQTPEAVNDSASLTVEAIDLLDDNTIQITVSKAITLAVLTNDRDRDGDKLSLIATGPAKFGNVGISGKTLIYQPNNNGKLVFDVNAADLTKFYAGDSFSYTVSDGQGGQATATVKLTPDQMLGL